MRRTLRLAGLLALVLAGSLLASTGPVLAASPLNWATPVQIDSQSRAPELDSVSCPSSELCVAADAFGNVITSTEPTGGADDWVVAHLDGGVVGGNRIYGEANGNRIWGVSCVSGRLCVAVDAKGNVVTSTDPAGGASEWSVAHVDEKNQLLGVSCVSGPLCVAVDSAGDVVTSTDPTGGEHAWVVTHVDEHVIRGVSCSSTTLCAAVDANGNVITSTDPAGGEHAWNVAHVDSEDDILGVSCPSTSLCIAVDAAGKVLTSTEPAGGAPAWSASEVDAHALGGVSCSSEALCVAYDAAGNVLTSTAPTMGKSAWSVANVDPNKFLWGVSCTSGLCMTVNGDGNVLSSTDPTEGTGAWATAHVENADAASLLGVSCASLALCVAVDDAGGEVRSTDPTGGAQAWSRKALGQGEEGLLGISCPSISLCVAGAEDAVLSTNPTGSTSAWLTELSYTFPTELYREGEEIFGPFASVTCASESLCLASLDTSDDYNELLTSADPLGDEGAWHRVHEEQVVGVRNSPPANDNDPVLGVSCASESLCAAVDLAGNVLTSTDPGSAESTWTIFPVDTHPIWSLSCPSTSLCIAVDGAGDVLSSTNPTGGSAAWSLANVDGSNRLSSVSCASRALCVVVDDAGNVLVSTDPTGAESWSMSSADPGQALTSVSCIAEGLCMAVDNTGNAVTGAFSPPTDGEGSHVSGESNGGLTAGTITTSPGPSPPPTVASGVFSILSIKVGRDGQIVLTLRAPAAGSLDGRATASIRMAAAGVHKRKTKRTRKITYGTTSATAPGADTMTVTIKPTRSALSALKSSRTLRVPVTIVFHPHSGSPTTVSETVTVRYLPPRRSRACFALKGVCRGKR